MALILARSPYFIDRLYDDNPSLSINIRVLDDTNTLVLLKTYNLAFKNATYLDISPLIRDYLIDYEVLTE